MALFRIMQRRDNEIVVMKVGWSWSAFFLDVFWLLYRGLTTKALMVSIQYLLWVLLGITVSVLIPGIWTVKVICFVYGLLLALIKINVGEDYNDWMAKHLENENYKYAGVIEAKNAEVARLIYDTSRVY